jgi:hypothetical protein
MKRFKKGDMVAVKKITDGINILIKYDKFFNKIAVITEEYNDQFSSQRWNYRVKFHDTGDAFYVHEEDIGEVPYRKTELFKALNGE